MITQVLVVDDDSFFTTMFTNLIDWRGFDCCIAATVTNGQAAIEIINSRKIDIVFTDMSMPFLDGVELIRYIAQHHSHIRCVALSGYDDFHYVKESFKMGAIDYLLKHTLTRQGLEALLGSIVQQSPASAPRHDALLAMSQQDFLYGLLQGNTAMPETGFFAKLQLPVLERNLLLFLIAPEGDMHSFAEKPAHIRTNIISVIQTILDRLSEGIVFYCEDDSLIYALMTCNGFFDPIFTSQTSALFQRQVSNSLQRYFNISTLIMASTLFDTLQQLPQAYTDLVASCCAQSSPKEEQSAPISFEIKKRERYSSHVYGALKIIHKQFRDSALSLNMIASELFINVSYLCKIFRNECGIGLPEYLTQYRIEQAKELLLSSALSVKQIAMDCGFENYNYFFRVFKKQMGSTPLEFRRQAVE